MNRIYLNFAWLSFALAGCQGMSGYSAKNVTRVPPIGTGTYQVPGSYYGNSSAPATNAATASATTATAPAAGGLTGSPPNSTVLPNAVANVPSTSPQVTPADYSTSPDANLGVPAVTPASGPVNTTASGNLQWQR